jgi:hypothetical protein
MPRNKRNNQKSIADVEGLVLIPYSFVEEKEAILEDLKDWEGQYDVYERSVV